MTHFILEPLRDHLQEYLDKRYSGKFRLKFEGSCLVRYQVDQYIICVAIDPPECAPPYSVIFSVWEESEGIIRLYANRCLRKHLFDLLEPDSIDRFEAAVNRAVKRWIRSASTIDR